MVGSLAALFGSGLGCADVHLSIDLTAVGVDDLCAKTPAQFHGKLGLAHGCRANDGDGRSGVYKPLQR